MGAGGLLLVPVGSCEQHGPHLPLGTDTRLAEALARAAATRRADVVCSPALAIGASGEHRGFPGTLSIGTDVLCEVAVELARSALPGRSGDHAGRAPFDGVLFVNAHGGNHEALRRALLILRAERRRVALWHARVPDGDAHAGLTETSLMLHLHPELVRMAEATAGCTAPVTEIFPVLREEGLAAVTANGVLGDPRGADAGEGARLFDGLLRELLATLDRLASDPAPPGP